MDIIRTIYIRSDTKSNHYSENKESNISVAKVQIKSHHILVFKGTRIRYPLEFSENNCHSRNLQHE